MILDRVMPWRRRAKTTRLAATLQTVLETALRCTVFYPRAIERLQSFGPQGAVATQVLQASGPKMMAAADKLASVISQLGDEPRWNLDCRPDEIEPPHYCAGQVVRLESAVRMLQDAVPSITDESLLTVLKSVISDFDTQVQALHEMREQMNSKGQQ